jgi:hypothetical protein
MRSKRENALSSGWAFGATRKLDKRKYLEKFSRYF